MDAFVKHHVCSLCGQIGTNVTCNHCGLSACRTCKTATACCVKLGCLKCHKRKNWALKCDRCFKYLCAHCAPLAPVFATRTLCRLCRGDLDIEALGPCLAAFESRALNLRQNVRRRIQGV